MSDAIFGALIGGAIALAVNMVAGVIMLRQAEKNDRLERIKLKLEWKKYRVDYLMSQLKRAQELYSAAKNAMEVSNEDEASAKLNELFILFAGIGDSEVQLAILKFSVEKDKDQEVPEVDGKQAAWRYLELYYPVVMALGDVVGKEMRDL